MKNLFKLEIPEKRNFGLDLLRFIAIFTVLVSHSITVLPERYYFVHKFITDGVLIFFVLSGFLIGRILIRDFEHTLNFSNILSFWKRRWFRTLPAYYFTILLIIFISLISHNYINREYLTKSLFFAQNLVIHKYNFFAESWSLAIEEWFYLLMPLLIFLLSVSLSKNIKQIVLISFFIILIFSLLIRSYIFHCNNIASIQQWDTLLRSPVITRLDSIFVGVLGAWFYHYKKDFFTENRSFLFVIGVITFFANKIYCDYFFSYNFYTCVLYFILCPFSILLMVPKFYYMGETKLPFLNSIITKGSLISYSMYLLNLTVISILILQPLTLNIWIKFILFWVATITASILMYKYVEQPFMRLRDR
ncbi:acyltransferase family protein [Chryseobacterium sp. SN22]|uniref:acyltransferase family protein n=1 Tax=Chryseobacterium sp. SN22 TaxID=2606431 RepID=UPI0016295EF5